MVLIPSVQVEAKIKGDKDKAVFKNYKREVFHKALSYILESLEDPAEYGHEELNIILC